MRITVPWLRERSPRGAGRHRSHCLELRGCSEGPCHRDLVWGELGKFCGHSMSLITRRQQKQVSALQECCPWRVKNGLLSAASYMLWKIQLYLGIPQLFCGQNSSSFQVWVATPNSGPVSELFINASFISPAPCECFVILEVRDLICRSPTWPSVQRTTFHLLLFWMQQLTGEVLGHQFLSFCPATLDSELDKI